MTISDLLAKQTRLRAELLRLDTLRLDEIRKITRRLEVIGEELRISDERKGRTK